MTVSVVSNLNKEQQRNERKQKGLQGTRFKASGCAEQISHAIALTLSSRSRVPTVGTERIVVAEIQV